MNVLDDSLNGGVRYSAESAMFVICLNKQSLGILIYCYEVAVHTVLALPNDEPIPDRVP